MDLKILQKYADPGLVIPSSHGLLHAEPVNYIIRTAVKIINHQKILVLYIYDRKEAKEGVSRPLWTMFQHGRSEYITLEQKAAPGRSKWRTACFENLGKDYIFINKCAFYSQGDEARVQKYFNSADGAITTLVRVQSRIKETKLKKRRQERDREILERMKPVRALPRGLKSWIHRTIMPAYFFYDYKRNQKNVPGVCSACGAAITLAKVKHNGKATCPHCKRELIMKSRKRRGLIHDEETCQVVQRAGEGEVVVRIIKVYYNYFDDEPKESVYENARKFLWLDETGKVQLDSYYYSYGHAELTHWKHGDRPKLYPYQKNFEAETCGYVYTQGLSLIGTPWQYCPLKLFCEHFPHERMELVPFLNAYIVHPKFEHLIKVGFFELADGLAYGYRDTTTLDETQNRTHRILRVAPEDVDFLRKMEAEIDLSALQTYQEYCQANLKDRQALFLWTKENQVEHNIDKILQNLSVHKFLRYMNEQYSFLRLRKTDQGLIRYKDMQTLVTEFADYLDMCKQEKYDLKNSFVLFPKDLQKSHDTVAGRIKHKADVKARRKFKAAYRRIGSSLDFERDGLKIICPSEPADVISEGQKLHHCVGGYVNSIAKGNCLILFVRRCSDLAEPFYTVELREGKVTQLKGMSNARATPEVQVFVNRWEREVLNKRKVAA